MGLKKKEENSDVSSNEGGGTKIVLMPPGESTESPFYSTRIPRCTLGPPPPRTTMSQGGTNEGSASRPKCVSSLPIFFVVVVVFGIGVCNMYGERGERERERERERRREREGERERRERAGDLINQAYVLMLLLGGPFSERDPPKPATHTATHAPYRGREHNVHSIFLTAIALLAAAGEAERSDQFSV